MKQTFPKIREIELSIVIYRLIENLSKLLTDFRDVPCQPLEPHSRRLTLHSQFFAGFYQDVFGNGVRSGKLEAASVACPIVVTARAQVSSHMAVFTLFPEHVHL